MFPRQVIVPLSTARHLVAPATALRSTVLVGSIRGLKGSGHYARYVTHLPAHRLPAIEGLTAGHWVPMDLALDHYRACDRLDLSPETVQRIGDGCGRFVGDTVYTALGRLAKVSGVSVWTAFGQASRMTSLTWEGTACTVVQVGPKDARYEWFGQPLATSRYFRYAFAAFLRAVLQLFSEKMYVSLVSSAASTLVYRCSWV